MSSANLQNYFLKGRVGETKDTATCVRRKTSARVLGICTPGSGNLLTSRIDISFLQTYFFPKSDSNFLPSSVIKKKPRCDSVQLEFLVF